MAVILAKNGRPAGPRNPIDVKIPLFVVRDKDQHADGALLVCRICKSRGERTVFYPDEEAAFARHVQACYARHEQEVRERSLRVKAPALFDPEVSGDVERGKWVRRHRKELIEGTKKL